MTDSIKESNYSKFRIKIQELDRTFNDILLKNNFSKYKAQTCARIFSENTLDGVYSHGINRFPRFIEYIKKGFIKPDKEAILQSASGGVEQWNGHLDAGPVNAIKATDRSMELAKKFGLGCVAMSNTNHWMRGGTYGWRAAKEGFVFIGWTNTMANMPAWGATDSRLGNNPLVLAVPFNNEAIVLDMAMTQFSFGKLEALQSKNQNLPLTGGYDKNGMLTTDPSSILDSQRPLPIGYWKGAGLSLLLDILAVVLSGGLSTQQISKLEREYSVSQVFISFDISKLENYPSISKTINEIIDDFHNSILADKTKDVFYPGEQTLKRRKENMKDGIPVDKSIWEQICSL